MPGTRAEQHLPPHLAERVTDSGRAPCVDAGEFVLYWARAALRGHENPALDAAVAIANGTGRPLFVYQGLAERYPYASDRHHRFVLESARDFHAELASRGIASAFHLERAGHRGPVLRELAARAVAIVTESVPVDPLRTWTERLAATVAPPVLAVDASCLVPMPLVRRAYARAFEFRDATADERAARIRQPWTDLRPRLSTRPTDLGFEPVDLDAADPDALIAACDIDHAVPAVPHTVGGSRAGYARWNAFRDDRLRRYAKMRNDPLHDGVSRMSAYLHYGCVSPFRLAREAEASGHGDKYLDELLVWRELAWNFCRHRRDHETLDALPEWARDTLSAHAADPRSAHPSQTTLALGRTGDPLWDTAQRSLLLHGELHNNVRMTWGKAVLDWTEDPATALRWTIDLNHRYALDGRDPASYGGLLWCFGQFDRPHSADRPVSGRLRERTTAVHAARLDVDRYRRIVAKPPRAEARIAIVGGGIAAAACAGTLAEHGLDVTVFDKARGPGGRMATRRTDAGGFDHGAQFFTARDPRFAHVLGSWLHDGLAAPWDGSIVTLEADGHVTPQPDTEPRYVAVPRMSVLARTLLESAPITAIRYGWRVEALEIADERWRLLRDDGITESGFDAVLVTAPSTQAAPLLEPHTILGDRAATVHYVPSLAVGVAFANRLPIDFDGATVVDGPLAWIARDSSKPGRAPGERWMLHATAEFAERHFEDDPAQNASRLLSAFAERTGIAPGDGDVHVSHRWKFAFPIEPLGESSAFDARAGLGAAGDWFLGGRIEDAYLSGTALAGRVLAWAARDDGGLGSTARSRSSTSPQRHGARILPP